MDWSDTCDNIPKNEESDRTVEIEIPFHLLQFLSSEGSNIQNVCRICLSMQQNMICLFSSRKLPLTLPYMLASFSSMQAQPGDGLPTQICVICEAEVISCYNFKVKCEKSEHTLKSLLKGEIIAKETHSDPKEDKHEVQADDNFKEHKDATTTYLLETSDKRTCTMFNENKKHVIEDVKEEVEIHEDIQFLEALSDDVSDEETLCIVQNIKSAKRKSSNKTAAKLVSEISNKNKTILDSALTCAYCSRRFKKQNALLGHMKKTHGSEVNSHQCKQCSEVFNSAHDLALHSALHSKGPMWKCNTCPKEFKTKSMLRRHLLRHMESKKYSCAHCDKTFVEMYALRRHARVHTGELREKKHVCHICDKRYSENNLLVAHMTMHSGEKPFSCEECGKEFASARLLQSHRAVHSTRKPYACRYCDRRFRHETTLKTHHRTHTGERPYVCATCGKAFIQNSNLRLHMRTHTGERPYPCALCPRRFSSGSSLKNHLRTHSGEKPFACPYCSKRFARVNFKAHLRQHTGDKPFECSVCLKKFVGAARLRDHCRIHTGEKPFECTVCAESFATKSHLRKHSKLHEDGKKPKKKVVFVKHVENNTEENKTLEDEETGHTLEVSGELVVQNDAEEKTEILVVDNAQTADFENGNICLDGVTYVNGDVAYDGENINLVTMNEGGVSISSTSAMLDGTTVKLYQIDQSLLQIHSTGAQVTISKITSKMTANF